MEIENVATEQVVNEQPQQETEVREEPKERTFTQSELDSIVKKRLDKAEQKFNERLNALEQAQKLQTMNEQEKVQYQAQQEREAFEKERQAFYEKRDAFNKAQYKMTIEKQFSEKGLPTSMADLLTSLDAEQVNTKINEMAEQFGVSVNTQIQEKLKQTTTPQEPIQRKQLFTLQEIQAMSLEEYQANKELINESLKEIYKK